MDLSSEAAYDDLFRSDFEDVWRSVRLIVGDREVARDVCQDAFAAAFAHWPKVSRYDRPGAWVRRVAIRDAVRVATKDQRRNHAALAEAAERSRRGLVDDTSGSAAGGDIADAIDRLTPKQRAAIVLHHFLDLSVGDVAADLGCSASTASVHLHRGRARLAQILDSEADDGVR